MQPGDTAVFARGASCLRHFSQPECVSRIHLVPRDGGKRKLAIATNPETGRLVSTASVRMLAAEPEDTAGDLC